MLWGHTGHRLGLAGGFQFDAFGFVWEMTEQTRARVASPCWHQRFVRANPLQRAAVQRAEPYSH